MRSKTHQFSPFDVTRLGGDGVTVVTPNRRLAVALKRVHDHAQQQAGRRAWVRPDILPMATFFARSYRALTLSRVDATAPPQLIDGMQSHALWEQVIGQSSLVADAGSLLSIAQTARQAMAAWAITNQWQLQSAMRGYPLHEDGRAFAAWAQHYQQRCREMHVIDEAVLPDVLADGLAAAVKVLPKRLLTAGFDIVTPQQQAFLHVCASLGVAVETLSANHPETPAEAHRVEFSSEEAELRGCAQWARAVLEADPDTRIAIVVPDLGGKRSRITRALTDALRPVARAELAGANESLSALFNISLGLPLGEYALVHDALLLLEFSRRRPMAAPAFSALLRSPFIAGAEPEMGPRASLDALLREMGAVEMSLSGLQKKLQSANNRRLSPRARACPEWCEIIDRVAALPLRAHAAARPTPHHWSRHFTRVLGAWGFPGGHALGSTDFQVLAKFREALETLAALQLVQPHMRADEALQQLRRIVGDTVFQPESSAKTEAPIQVLGILESAGQAFDAFDALWVTGLSDDAWPPAARPNPFIPVGLQRRAGVIEASAATSLALDQRITQGWLQSADQVVFSHALHEGGLGNGEPARAASALIRDFPLLPAAVQTPNFAEAMVAMRQFCPLAAIPDAPFLPLPAPTAVAGGSAIMRDQAACPFRAFARHRLGAVALDTPEAGPGSAERGTLLHRVLSLVWTRIQSHAALLALDEAAAHAIVRQCVGQAISEAHTDGQETLTGRFAAIEQTRLCRLVAAWLEVERARPPFTVLACEQSRQIAIGGLTMRLRLDRLDRLPDGTDALIDYKTGVAQFKSWLGMRPDEPQLPLYFYTADHPVSAVAFARLKRGRTFGFEGVSATDNALPGVTPVEQKRGMEKLGYISWDVLVQQWEAALEQLARQFADGINTVNPKNGAPTCAQCDLQSVCRVAETSINAAKNAGAGDE